MSHTKETFFYEINQENSDSEMRRYQDQMFWYESEERVTLNQAQARAIRDPNKTTIYPINPF